MRGQVQFVMFGPKPAPEQLRIRSLLLKGAIFSDGSTWGDPAWVRVLILRRAAAIGMKRKR